MISYDSPVPQNECYALVVDDHPLVARGMTEFLRLHKKLDDAICVGTAQEALLTMARRGPPALALVDFWLADGATTHFIRDLQAMAPRVRVLMVSGDSHGAIVTKVRSSGAHGFLHKQQGPEIFTAAVDAVLAGGTWFDNDVSHADAASLSREVPLAPSDLGLTARQGQILAFILEGQPNRYIANALNVSEHTIKEHVTAILAKLEVRNRVEAITKLRGVRLEIEPQA